MKNRVFLVFLVLVLILVQAMLRNVETNYLTAGPADMLFGVSPQAGMEWSAASLTFSLPFAVFSAAALVTALGLGADCLSWVYDLRGVSEPCGGVYSRLGTCAMWCGWPLMAASTAAVFAAFPNASAGAESLAHSPLFAGLMLFAGIYIVCRVVCLRFRGAGTACTGIAIFLLTAEGLGHLCMGEPFSFFRHAAAEILFPLAGLALAYAVRMLLRPAAAPRIIGALLIAAACGAVCHFFSQGCLFHTDIPYFGPPCYIYAALMLAVLAGLTWLKWRALPVDEADS